MMIKLIDCYCWEPSSPTEFSYLAETQPIIFDIDALAPGKNCRTIKNGPYNFEVCMTKDPGKADAATIEFTGSNAPLVVGQQDHGEQFVHMAGGVKKEKRNADGSVELLGSFEGCFKINW